MFGWFKKKTQEVLPKTKEWKVKFELIGTEMKEYTLITGVHRYKFLTPDNKTIIFEVPFVPVLTHEVNTDNFINENYLTKNNFQRLSTITDMFCIRNKEFDCPLGNTHPENYLPTKVSHEIDGILYKVSAWISCEFIERKREVVKKELRIIREVLTEVD